MLDLPSIINSNNLKTEDMKENLNCMYDLYVAGLTGNAQVTNSAGFG